MISGTASHLQAIWGTSSSDVFAVGDDGIILHHAGGVPPGVATSPASDMTANSAVLNGTGTSPGTASSISVAFEWGRTMAYGNATAPQAATGTGGFSTAAGGDRARPAWRGSRPAPGARNGL